jgi:hypothetical protein
MSASRDLTEVNRRIADHVAHLRERLDAGREEIERQRRAADETREHIDGVSRWIGETEHLRRRGPGAA